MDKFRRVVTHFWLEEGEVSGSVVRSIRFAADDMRGVLQGGHRMVVVVSVEVKYVTPKGTNAS